MSLPTTNPTTTQAWGRLKDAYARIAQTPIQTFFDQEPNRASEFSVSLPGLVLDYSKNRIDRQTRDELIALARELDLERGIAQYFSGEPINHTEGRAVLHTALRAAEGSDVRVDGENVIPAVYQVRSKMKEFTEGVLNGTLRGSTGKTFTDVVNIGIGGSDLGPVMVTEALAAYRTGLRLHYVNNVDGDHVTEIIRELDRETTLFIIVSKSFGTQETLTNARTIRDWFLQERAEEDIADHFVAVSTNASRIAEFGIREDFVFPMSDWVGGRFSLWSAVGLSISLGVGYDNFERLLDGAQAADEHFRTAPFEKNIPVLLGLIGCWYADFFGCETEAVVPYSQYLHRLPAYLQQGVMESNGKSMGRDGRRVNYPTCGIIWGEPGTNSQHAFFQLIHQGTPLIPVDFIGFRQSVHGNRDHHDKLMANFFAQTEALMKGKSTDTAFKELLLKGIGETEARERAPFKTFEGNKPTNTLLFDRLTPASLGQLIAFYEHKIFVQGYIWNIFSYDQWGVELGKELATTILNEIKGGSISADHDPSTLNLLRYYSL